VNSLSESLLFILQSSRWVRAIARWDTGGEGVLRKAALRNKIQEEAMRYRHGSEHVPQGKNLSESHSVESALELASRYLTLAVGKVCDQVATDFGKAY